MKEYPEQVMHQSIDEKLYEDTDSLPLGCRNVFELNILKTGQQAFLPAAPFEDMSLTELRKMRFQSERYTGYLCAFYLKKVNRYAAPKMVQVYLPFMGMLLRENAHRTPKSCAVISFLTQKLLLKALYENRKDISAVQASKLLEVSGMSVTRCYDEIEAPGMPFLKTQRRSRRFYAPDDKKKMWETMLPFMRNPVIRTFNPEREPEAERFPKMTELFSRSNYLLKEEEGLTPLHIDASVSSLSAILLNEAYYQTLPEGREIMAGSSGKTGGRFFGCKKTSKRYCPHRIRNGSSEMYSAPEEVKKDRERFLNEFEVTDAELKSLKN